MKQMLFLAFFTLGCFSLAETMTTQEQLSAQFHSANKFYDEGNYDKAIESYELMIQKGLENGEVYFNLANAYFRSGALGKSIFSFLKAQALLPRDADIRFNLEYARKKTTDQIEEGSSTLDFIVRHIPSLNVREAYYALLIASLVFWTLAGVSLFKPLEWIRWARNTALVFFILTLGISAEKTLNEVRFGTIRVEEAKVYSASGRDNVVLFTLHEGAEFTILKTSNGNWVQISLSDGKKGWVSVADVLI